MYAIQTGLTSTTCKTLCSTHLTSNPSPPSRTRRLSRTTGKLRWVLRLCKLRAFPSLHGDLRALIQLIGEEKSHLKRRVGVNLLVSEEESDRTGRLQSGRLQLQKRRLREADHQSRNLPRTHKNGSQPTFHSSNQEPQGVRFKIIGHSNTANDCGHSTWPTGTEDWPSESNT